ncbi:MAG: hypothetical protein Q9168_004027 [Polycauliona sp. 1 TL-2023]
MLGTCIVNSSVNHLTYALTREYNQSFSDEAHTSTSTDWNAFAREASIEFLGFLGYTSGGCPFAEEFKLTQDTQATVIKNATASNTSANFTRTRANTNAALPSGQPTSRPTRQIRIAVGITIPIFFILVCTLLWIGIQKHRKDKRKRIGSDENGISEVATEKDQPPYFQPKGELDANGNIIHEKDGEEQRYELGAAGTEIKEMSTALMLYNFYEINGIWGLLTNVSSVHLSDSYKVTATATENLTDPFYSRVLSSEFRAFLELHPTCTDVVKVFLNTTLPPVANLRSTPPIDGTVLFDPTASSSATANFSRTSVSNTTGITPVPARQSDPEPMSRRIRIALGVSLSTGFILICLFLALSIRRYRRNKKKKISSGDNEDALTTVVEDDQAPYLQQKGELDAPGNSKFELGAEQRRYELEGDIEIHEMPTALGVEELNRSGRRELRGPEHSREMTA